MIRIARTVNICKHLVRNISNRNVITETNSSKIIVSSVPNILLQSHYIQQPLIEKYRKTLEDLPFTNIANVRIQDPNNFINELFEFPKYVYINELPNELPVKNKIEAARLIVIRKRKMKKHKLKKLRKKMKFEWAKVRQRREMRKEKGFQAGLIEQIKIAERFSAENYVNQKLKEANETPIPRYWKGRRLPQFIIKEKLGLK